MHIVSEVQLDMLRLPFQHGELVEAVDKDGNPHPLADQQVTIKVSGKAILAGAGNGDPQSFEPFQDDRVDLFYGKAMIIIRSTEETGKATISLSADGLKGAKQTIEIR